MVSSNADSGTGSVTGCLSSSLIGSSASDVLPDEVGRFDVLDLGARVFLGLAITLLLGETERVRARVDRVVTSGAGIDDFSVAAE